MPGYSPARPRVFANRSNVTNLETKAQILDAVFGPIRLDSVENIRSASFMIRSTSAVSENGWPLSRPSAMFCKRLRKNKLGDQGWSLPIIAQKRKRLHDLTKNYSWMIWPNRPSWECWNGMVRYAGTNVLFSTSCRSEFCHFVQWYTFSGRKRN